MQGLQGDSAFERTVCRSRIGPTQDGVIAALVLVGAWWLTASPAWAACSTSICVPSTGACTISGTNTIDNGCTLNFVGRAVTVHPNATLTTASTGHSYTILAASLVVDGILKAYGGALKVTTTGNFIAQSVSNSPGKIDVRDGGSFIVTAGGTVEILGQDVNADGGSTNNDGGTISAIGTSVTTTSPIHADGNPGYGGTIRLVSSSGAMSIGDVTTVNGSSANTAVDGGFLHLKAATNLTVTENLQANGAQNGSGGTIDLNCGGTASLSGNYQASGVGGGSFANGGNIDLVAGSGTISGNWTATANFAALGGSVSARATTGALTLSSGKTIDVSGGGTGGGVGGFVELRAETDVTVAGTITANAGGQDSTGGDVVVRAPETVTVSGTIEARSTANNGLRNGRIHLGPACDVVVSGTVKTRDTAGGGTNTVHYHRSFNASGGTLRADDITDGSGGNLVVCGCEDGNSDGTCDSPETCDQQPTTSGATLLPSLSAGEPALHVACN